MKNIYILSILALFVLFSLNSRAQSITLSGITTNATCGGQCDGLIDLSISGGQTPYSFFWSNGATLEDLASLCAGTYTVTVIDNSVSGTITPMNWSYTNTGNNATLYINQFVVLNGLAAWNGDYIGVFYDDNGTLECGGYVVYNGVQTLMTAWGDDSTTSDKDGFAANEAYIWKLWHASTGNLIDLTPVYIVSFPNQGNYTVNGMSGVASLTGTFTPPLQSIDTFTITEPVPISVSTTLSDYGGYQISAPGASDGFITLAISGGNPPYSVLWSNGSTQTSLNNLTAGTYSVTLSDANGCSFTESYMLTDPGLIQLSASVLPTGCNGTCSGSIDLQITGGISPYQIIWSNGSTTANINNLCVGNYIVTVTDSIGSITSSSFSVLQTAIQFNSLLSDYNGYNTSLYGACDGSIELVLSGGQSPYAFNWSNGATTQNVSNLCAGAISVIVTDFGGCSDSMSFVLTEPPFVNTPLSLSGTINNLTCGGQCNASIDLTVSGGLMPYSFIWSNGSTSEDLNGLCTGVYVVSVLDSLGQSATDTFEIVQNTFNVDGVVSLYSGYNTSQFGVCDGSIELVLSGGQSPYDFNWSNGATTQNVSNLCAGAISVIVTDFGGCSDSMSLVLTEPPFVNTPLSLSGTINNLTCGGQCNASIDLTVSGGLMPYSFIWSNGSTSEDLNGLCTGVYVVSVLDSLGQSATDTFEIVQNTFNVDGVVSLYSGYNTSQFGVCDGSIELVLSGGQSPYAFNWSNTASTQDVYNLCAGSYSVVVLESWGCSVTLNFILSEPPQLPFSVTGTTVDPLCWNSCDGSIDLQVNGSIPPFTFTWSDGDSTQNRTNLCPGTYSVTVSESNSSGAFNWSYDISPDNHLIAFPAGSVSFSNATLEVGDVVGVFYTHNGSAQCGGYTVYDGNPFVVAAWGSSTSYPNLFNPGEQFSWKVWKAATQEVVNMTASYLTNQPNTSSYQNLGLSAIDSLYGVYSPGATNNQTTSATFQIMQPDSFIIAGVITPIDSVLGQNGFIDISISGGNSPFSFIWSTGETSEDLNVNVAGMYGLTVSDALGCVKADSFVVDANVYPISYNYTVTNPGCAGSCNGSIEIQILSGSAPVSIQWSNGASGPLLTNLCAGTYNVSISNSAGQNIENIVVNEPTALSVNLTLNNINPVAGIDGSASVAVTGGTPPYYYQWSNGSSQMMVDNLSPGTYALTVSDANGCSTSQNFEIILDVLPPWVVQSSSLIHEVYFDASSITLVSGAPIEDYDFVGVFADSAGTPVCAGMLMWQGSTALLQAFGDDPATTPHEGFTSGESLVWKIWDASANTVYSASSVYDNTYSNLGYFAAGDSSLIDTLQTTSLSGSVSVATKSSGAKSPLPDGKLILFNTEGQSIMATKITDVVGGIFEFNDLAPGDYLCYAIPKPELSYGLPAYYVSRDNWQGASWVHVSGYTGGVNIDLDPVNLPGTGSGSIGGKIYAGENSWYNPAIFNDDWFPVKAEGDSAARNIPVLIYDENQNPMDFRLSDEAGSFTFDNLEFGTYYIRAEQAGFQANLVEVTLDANQPSYNSLTFSMSGGSINTAEQVNVFDDLLVYPNPGRGEYTLQSQQLNGKIHVKIFNVNGKLLKYMEMNEERIRIDLKDQPAGVYFIRVISDEKSAVLKIIQQ